MGQLCWVTYVTRMIKNIAKTTNKPKQLFTFFFFLDFEAANLVEESDAESGVTSVAGSSESTVASRCCCEGDAWL
jgi:hypothetical protein